MSEVDVVSEIAGTVWQIEAAVGQVLEEDDVILIVECMKMEIPVLAPCRGTLKRMSVEAGEVIKEGVLLAILDGP